MRGAKLKHLQQNGNDLLNRVSAFIRRFVALSDEQTTMIALWVAHTHALQAAETTPYLNITSAEKQCGKTRLLEVLRLLVANPWLTGRASAAALVRKIDAHCPTLLLDESDAAFSGDKEYAETLRGVLNSGHSREGVTSLCVGQGANIGFKDFHVFCPKAIAGIGKLPDTVADRSIPIRMKRRAPHEHVERFRLPLVRTEASELSEQLSSWIQENLPLFATVAPSLPDQLSDRQQDGAEPLLALAEVAGGSWPEGARAALLALLNGETAEDDSIGVRLLFSIYAAFTQQQATRLATADLIALLCDSEPQWLEFSHGKPVSSAVLARLLKRFGISHRKLRFEDVTVWGYLRESFEDTWARYLRRNLEQVEQDRNNAEKSQLSMLEQTSNVPDAGNGKGAVKTRGVPCVPVSSQVTAQQERPCWTHGKHPQWWERQPIGSGQWVCGKCHP
jgi:hypothetical protein